MHGHADAAPIGTASSDNIRRGSGWVISLKYACDPAAVTICPRGEVAARPSTLTILTGASQDRGERRAMRVAIVGAGGLGGLYGGLLARSGLDVTYIARGRSLDALREHGL